MDKNDIKTFAIESRKKLMADVEYQMNILGITPKGINKPTNKAEGMESYTLNGVENIIYDKQIQQRESLVKEVQSKGYENVIEEVAYTWFNRIIAIRYMEVNDYLPTRTRVLSSETEGKIEPDIITEAFDLDLDYTDEDKKLIFQLKDENELDEIFHFLFLKQCNKLNEILPELFEKTEDYSELLLNISFTDSESIVRKLIDTIPEEAFMNQVEIIGWMYQYYNFERKDNLINGLKPKTIDKQDIPAVTQLFTPEWIVKYMVDNSLGRYWIERNENTILTKYLQYYVGEAEQDSNLFLMIEKIRKEKINPKYLKFFDPCMGSGHILVYAFDVYFKIYQELGYLNKDIPELILNNNLYGLDIDDRAYQLAYFSILMKARKYDKNIFSKKLSLNIYAFKDSNLSQNTLNYVKNFDNELYENVTYLNNKFSNAKEFGSLIQINNINLNSLESKIEELLNNLTYNVTDLEIKNNIEHNLNYLIQISKILSKKYEIVVTNPPYMNKFDKELKDFAKKYYKDYNKDLFSMFTYRNFGFTKKNGYLGFMTPMPWMFLKNFEKLRKFVINQKSIISLIELEYNALWEIEAHVPVCTYILSNNNYNKLYNGIYIKLSEFTGGLQIQKNKTLLALKENVDYKYISQTNNFSNIPSSPIAYWANNKIYNLFFQCDKLEDFALLKSGKSTGGRNDELFKLWYEVNYTNIVFNEDKVDNIKKFLPLNKGGSYRKWYGNLEYVSLKEFATDDSELKKALTWSDINSSYFSARIHKKGVIANNVGKRAYFSDENLLYYCLGFLNTNISSYLLDLIIPTLHFDIGYVGKLPLIIKNENQIVDLTKKCIELVKDDWDMYETSWDFKTHHLLKNKKSNLENSFNIYYSNQLNNISLLKEYELNINEIFLNTYNLKEVIPNIISDKMISIKQPNLKTDIKSFISYAVGCILGRYSLDEEGLIYAGGEFDINKYNKLVPDDDNIVPVLDTAYFEDDLVGRFIEFLKITFGEDTLEENIDFIAGALNNKGDTSREKIRNYFLKDFFKDHIKTYQKRPIYWEFNSGKQNGFKCFVYMHRYDSDLVAKVRTGYLHKTQIKLDQAIKNCDNIIETTSSKSEKSKATKEKDKLIKQLKETKEYDEALAHIASQRIEIDLDDGVKVNYAKFQNVEVSKEGSKTKKINLLTKI